MPLTARVLVVAGPTGSGKTALALAMAGAVGGEIIGCDSVQVYRGFDVGSAKPTPAERAAVPHHLIDVVDWSEDFDAARYAHAAAAAIARVQAAGKVAIVCGGTGLYLRALLQERWHDDLPKDEGLRATLRLTPPKELYRRLEALDPQRARVLHPNDQVRVVRAVELATLLGRPMSELEARPRTPGADPALVARVVVLEPERPRLHAAIGARTAAMLRDGLLEEVRTLQLRAVDPTCKPMLRIGYKMAVAHLAGRLAAADLPAAIAAATRQYAKRQCTWFRKVDAALRLADPRAPEALDRCVALLRSPPHP